VVVQARAFAEHRSEFEDWLREFNSAVELSPGHIDYDLTAPTPGFDEDWVLVHRFTDRAAAADWVKSPRHTELIDAAQPLAHGGVDVHLFSSSEARQGKVSALFTTQVDPAMEVAFLAWSTRMATAQASFEGFAGYQVERPIEGVQPHWVAILSYDTDEHMRAWLSSAARAALLEDGASFAPRARVRIVRSGLDAWFSAPGGEAAAPTWKRNMLVLLVLYPVVFLTAFFIQDPLLTGSGMPFWLALFLANIISVASLGWFLVPAADRLFGWWLYPTRPSRRRSTIVGIAVVAALYGVSMAIAAWMSTWPWP
jgi:antibiotic biosynthesis monooxygenase (ABM) superfamily enzyme